MGLLTRDAILGAQDIQEREVEVPEWHGSVRVRGLTGSERDAFEAETVMRKGKDVQTNMRNIRARLVAMTVVDEGGKHVFGYPDLEALGGKSAKALDRVFGVAMELSGLRDDDVAELAKNSESAQADDSLSA